MVLLTAGLVACWRRRRRRLACQRAQHAEQDSSVGKAAAPGTADTADTDRSCSSSLRRLDVSGEGSTDPELGLEQCVGPVSREAGSERCRTRKNASPNATRGVQTAAAALSAACCAAQGPASAVASGYSTPTPEGPASHNALFTAHPALAWTDVLVEKEAIQLCLDAGGVPIRLGSGARRVPLLQRMHAPLLRRPSCFCTHANWSPCGCAGPNACHALTCPATNEKVRPTAFFAVALSTRPACTAPGWRARCSTSIPSWGRPGASSARSACCGGSTTRASCSSWGPASQVRDVREPEGILGI